MRSGRTLRSLPLLVLVPTLLGLVGTPARAATGIPSLRVRAATTHLTVTRRPNTTVFIDPGFFLTPVDGTFEVKVQRATLAAPTTVTQVWTDDTGEHTRALPPEVVARGWSGFSQFLHITVRNARGAVVKRMTMDFCPNSFSPQRVKPASPQVPSFPSFCGQSFNPFVLGSLWGIDRGWAVNPLSFGGFFGPGPFNPGFLRLRLPAGRYKVTLAIRHPYATLFGVDPADRLASVSVTLEDGNTRCCVGLGRGRTRAGGSAQGWSRLPDVADTSPPDPQYLPDLAATPAFAVFPHHTRAGNDLLSFASTEWVGGGSSLDVQGFRRPHSNVMDAYQYFFKDGQVVGRAPAGTLEFDTRQGHNHWHFEQFARYRLLDSTKTGVVRSHKQSFCIAPTDAIDTTIPGATMRPEVFGFLGACGNSTSLWVHESMPLGWGDTYLQYVAGQAFDITDVPNGTYYVAIEVNPEHMLYEQTDANDVALRRLILGGRRGHRTVCVPAIHGLDREGHC